MKHSYHLTKGDTQISSPSKSHVLMGSALGKYEFYGVSKSSYLPHTDRLKMNYEFIVQSFVNR